MAECDVCEVSLRQSVYRLITGRYPEKPTLCEECAEEVLEDLWEQQIPVAVVEERDDDHGV
jgi:hypothetical protein